MPNFTFCGGRERKTTTFFFFSWTSIQSIRIQLQKKEIANIWRFKRNGISAIEFEAARVHFLSDVSQPSSSLVVGICLLRMGSQALNALASYFLRSHSTLFVKRDPVSCAKRFFVFVLGVKRAVVANPRRDTCSREVFRHEVSSFPMYVFLNGQKASLPTVVQFSA